MNLGDSTAYYPVVFQLDNAGAWLPLRSDLHSSELPPRGVLTVDLPPNSSPANNLDFKAVQPLMIRFFDQTGVSFGQVYLLHPLPESRYKVSARYVGSRLRLNAPTNGINIRATWVLVPFEVGISPIFRAQQFTYYQPPATRIDWQQKQSADIDIGPTITTTILLHETSDGFALQMVQKGYISRAEHRVAWLYMHRRFFVLAALCAICGIFLTFYAYRDNRTGVKP